MIDYTYDLKIPVHMVQMLNETSRIFFSSNFFLSYLFISALFCVLFTITILDPSTIRAQVVF